MMAKDLMAPSARAPLPYLPAAAQQTMMRYLLPTPLRAVVCNNVIYQHIYEQQHDQQQEVCVRLALLSRYQPGSRYIVVRYCPHRGMILVRLSPLVTAVPSTYAYRTYLYLYACIVLQRWWRMVVLQTALYTCRYARSLVIHSSAAACDATVPYA